MRIGTLPVSLRVGNTPVLGARLGTATVAVGGLPPVLEEWYFTNATTLFVGVFWPEDDRLGDTYRLISAFGVALAGTGPIAQGQNETFGLEFDGLDQELVEAINFGVRLVAVWSPGTAAEQTSAPSEVFSAVWP